MTEWAGVWRDQIESSVDTGDSCESDHARATVPLESDPAHEREAADQGAGSASRSRGTGTGPDAWRNDGGEWRVDGMVGGLMWK